jgi:hypothetical protein
LEEAAPFLPDDRVTSFIVLELEDDGLSFCGTFFFMLLNSGDYAFGLTEKWLWKSTKPRGNAS